MACRDMGPSRSRSCGPLWSSCQNPRWTSCASLPSWTALNLFCPEPQCQQLHKGLHITSMAFWLSSSRYICICLHAVSRHMDAESDLLLRFHWHCLDEGAGNHCCPRAQSKTVFMDVYSIYFGGWVVCWKETVRHHLPDAFFPRHGSHYHVSELGACCAACRKSSTAMNLWNATDTNFTQLHHDFVNLMHLQPVCSHNQHSSPLLGGVLTAGACDHQLPLLALSTLHPWEFMYHRIMEIHESPWKSETRETHAKPIKIVILQKIRLILRPNKLLTHTSVSRSNVKSSWFWKLIEKIEKCSTPLFPG